MTAPTRSTTIDITPTWAGILPALIAVLQSPDAPQESKAAVMAELQRMARIADQAR